MPGLEALCTCSGEVGLGIDMLILVEWSKDRETEKLLHEMCAWSSIDSMMA